MKKLLMAVLFLGMLYTLHVTCYTSFAAEPAKEVTCYSLSAAPVMDGKVEGDKAWKNIPATDGKFFVFGTEGEISQKKTYFRTGYNADALFIAVECDEPDTKYISAAMKDNGELWTEDSVEVFIGQPGLEAEYNQFIVNAIGSRYNGIARTQTEASGWEVKTVTGNKMWSAEIRFPFKTLKANPKKGAMWSFNVCRNICSGAPSINTSWAQMYTSFHEPENFGKILFK